jgi:hypothetical protein
MAENWWFPVIAKILRPEGPVALPRHHKPLRREHAQGSGGGSRQVMLLVGSVLAGCLAVSESAKID